MDVSQSQQLCTSMIFFRAKAPRGMVFHQKARGKFFELYHHKDGMGITFFDDGNAMGWET